MNGSVSGNRGGLLFLGLFLALGMVVSSYLVSSTVQRVKLANQTIRVKGYTEREITSDIVEWRGEVQTRDPDLVTAYSRLEKDFGEVLAFIQKQGISGEEIKISPVSTRTLYKKTEKGSNTNEIEGYVLEQAIEIHSGNVELVSRLSRETTSLIRRGIHFSAGDPKYFCSRINDIKIELLGEATRNALLRAQQLARNSGSEVGNLRSCSQGVFQITPLYSTDVSNYGRYDTGTIEKAAKAVVTVEYSIRQ